MPQDRGHPPHQPKKRLRHLRSGGQTGFAGVDDKSVIARKLSRRWSADTTSAHERETPEHAANLGTKRATWEEIVPFLRPAPGRLPLRKPPSADWPIATRQVIR